MGRPSRVRRGLPLDHLPAAVVGRRNSDRCRFFDAMAPCDTLAAERPPPNKRLKLTGGDRSKGSEVLCAGAHELSFHYPAPCGRVARSLTAIR